MLAWSASLLGVQRGAFTKFAKSAAVLRHFCKEVPPDDVSEREYVEPPEYTSDDFKDLLKSEEEVKKFKLILMELASIREDCAFVPTEILPRDVRDLLTMTYMGRRKYYNFMFKREMSKRNKAAKKERNRIAREAERAATPAKEIPPGLFPFIRKQTMHRLLYGRRLMEAALFGQKLVFDLGYQEHMTNRETRNLAEQLQNAYGKNKIHPQPFDVTFCNLEENSLLDEMILQYFAGFQEDTYLLDKTNKNYLDLFPKDDLVYLTPDAPMPLQKFDPTAIYIIGGIVDLGNQRPLSFAKAKREGLQCRRFPIEEHVVLRSGAQRAFTLDTVMQILLSLKEHNNWPLAFQKLPRRSVEAILGPNSAPRPKIQRQAKRRLEREKSFNRPRLIYADKFAEEERFTG